MLRLRCRLGQTLVHTHTTDRRRQRHIEAHSGTLPKDQLAVAGNAAALLAQQIVWLAPGTLVLDGPNKAHTVNSIWLGVEVPPRDTLCLSAEVGSTPMPMSGEKAYVEEKVDKFKYEQQFGGKQ